MSSLLSLVYVSAGTTSFTDEQLMTLLESARHKNKKIGVTGLLLYNSKGTFLQIIEGDEKSIEDLYSIISNDTRHNRVNCLMRKHINERLFPDWKMGFKRVSSSDAASNTGVSAFFNGSADQVNFGLDHAAINTIFTHFKSEADRVNTS